MVLVKDFISSSSERARHEFCCLSWLSLFSFFFLHPSPSLAALGAKRHENSLPVMCRCSLPRVQREFVAKLKRGKNHSEKRNYAKEENTQEIWAKYLLITWALWCSVERAKKLGQGSLIHHVFWVLNFIVNWIILKAFSTVRVKIKY